MLQQLGTPRAMCQLCRELEAHGWYKEGRTKVDPHQINL